MANIPKLKGKIVEQGLTVEKLAQAVGMNRATMYRKFKSGGEQLTIDEVQKICDALQLSGDEATAIFLPGMSHNMR